MNNLTRIATALIRALPIGAPSVCSYSEAELAAIGEAAAPLALSVATRYDASIAELARLLGWGAAADGDEDCGNALARDAARRRREKLDDIRAALDSDEVQRLAREWNKANEEAFALPAAPPEPVVPRVHTRRAS